MLQQREILPTTFQCLFCNHENSVSVKIDKKASTGELSCKVCGQTFQTVTNCMSQEKHSRCTWVFHLHMSRRSQCTHRCLFGLGRCL